MGGQAGKITLPSNGLLLARKLRENLLLQEIKHELKNLTTQKEYAVEAYGPGQYWDNVVITGYTKHHLTHLQQRANVAECWAACFDGKHCCFSNQPL